jgi:Exonuclease VII small subunit
VKELEKGELPLEDALGKFAEGVSLSQVCLAKLNVAEQAVDKIIREEKGKLAEYPLKIQEGEKC